MAQSGNTTIIIYNTNTASAVPVAGNLTQGELAVNVTDKKLYSKDAGGNVVQVGSGPGAVDTLTNKSIALGSNTITGTTAQFNTALTDGDFVTRTGTETLTNKTITAPLGLVKGDVGLGNVDNTSNATERAAVATLTNKTIASPTLTGTTMAAALTVSGTLTAGTFSPSSISTGALSATTLDCRGNGGIASNVVVGYGAVLSTPTAAGATAIGGYTLQNLTSGNNNTAIGHSALRNITTGSDNTAIGNAAMDQCATGASANVAAGFIAMRYAAGSSNTGLGHQVMSGVGFTGSANVAVGNQALANITSGGSNVVIGQSAVNLSTGTSNTVVGNYSYGSSNGSYNTVLGFNTGYGISGAANIEIGSANSAGSGAPVFAIGANSNRISMGHTAITNAYIQVAWTVVSDARDKTELKAVPYGLDFISQLRPVSYRFRETRESDTPHGPTRYGFLAQDILKLEGSNPVIVDAEDPDKLRLNEQALIAVLVNAVQELKAEFDLYRTVHR